MNDMETLNNVMDNLLENRKIDFTSAELDIAISTQLKKVLHHVVSSDPYLTLAVSCLYSLIMTKEKKKEVELPAIGISTQANRELFNVAKRDAYIIACRIFDTAIKHKI